MSRIIDAYVIKRHWFQDSVVSYIAPACPPDSPPGPRPEDLQARLCQIIEIPLVNWLKLIADCDRNLD